MNLLVDFQLVYQVNQLCVNHSNLRKNNHCQKNRNIQKKKQT